jgi:SAM-dependent methyltransferase
VYDEIAARLWRSYDGGAAERDRHEVAPWKVEERGRFLALLREENKTTFLEVGAGTGRDSRFFQDQGLAVVSTDLSPEMVRRCHEKGLTAHVMDFLHLDFPGESFDAIYALNCLLHVPRADLRRVLERLRALLRPGGLFYLGVYGGRDWEGVAPEDRHEPKRFFCYRTDTQILEAVSGLFDVRSFRIVPLEGEAFHFQSLILQRPVRPPIEQNAVPRR